jgi:hypothetical protein
LIDLDQWLVDHDYYVYFSKSSEPNKTKNSRAHRHEIAIISRATPHDKDFGLSYWIRGIFAEEPVTSHGDRVRRVHFTESYIGPQESELFSNNTESYRVLNISGLHKVFLERLRE